MYGKTVYIEEYKFLNFKYSLKIIKFDTIQANLKQYNDSN